MGLHEDIAEVLFDEATIRERVRQLAAELDRDYGGREPVLVGMLRGSVYFLVDLSRALRIPHQVDFMSIAGYGTRHAATGAVRLLKDLDEDVTDRHVVLVEDVVDTGLTASYLVRLLRARRPASLAICTFLDKRARRIALNLPLAYVGFEAPDRFLVGYGLDYHQRYRNLPYIGVLREEIFQQGPP